MMETKDLEKVIEINQLRSDIREIDDFLSGAFNRKDAIEILKKHHFSDINIAIADVILNVNESTLEIENEDKIKWYLYAIKLYLIRKLGEKLSEK